MTRRGGQLPWGNRRRGGLYGGRQTGLGRPLLVAALLFGVVIVAAFLVMRSCGGEGCSGFYCKGGGDIATPEGYERLSDIWQFNEDKGAVPPDKVIQVQLPLKASTADARNLSFFRYVPETKGWEAVSAAVLDIEGKHASTTFNSAYGTIAVLRRLSPAGHIIAYLGHNGQLHPEAAARATIVHTADFRPSSDGSVSGELTDIKVTGARTDGTVAHYPVLFGDPNDKGFIPIVSGILANSAGRSNHVQQIVKLVVEKNVPGIDIQYLGLPATDRTSFALFIAELGQALKAQNKALTVTLPAPIRQQERIDEGAYDWAEIGKAADVVQIGVYRDQTTYRRDMPEILAYLATIVQPNKLVLTVTPYAAEKSPDGVRALKITDAMAIATRLNPQTGADPKLTTNSNLDIVALNINQTAGRSGVVWQPATASVGFSYEQGGGRSVWIENVFSVGFKLELIPKFKLGGVAVEDASADIYLGDIWSGLVPFITSGQPLLLQPNPQDLVPQWKVSKGQMEGGQKGILKWQTPAEPGSYTITIILSDGASQFENELAVAVQAKERATTTPTANP